MHVILNPTAGSGRAARLWRAIAEELARRRVPYACEVTRGPGTATRLTRQALRSGAQTIVVIGGDGTVNEVVNGFFLRGAPVQPGASIALVPAGSSCDVARNLGIPTGLAALDLLEDGRTLTVDVGRAVLGEDRGAREWYFLNNADVGIGARIAKRARRFRRIGGKLAFFAASLITVMQPDPWEGILTLDGEQKAINATTVVVALGPYTAGGMHMAPGARMDDGRFDVVTIGAMGTGSLVTNLLRIYSGGHLRDPRISLARAHSVAVDSPRHPLMQFDGELAGPTPVNLAVLPGALQMHVARP